MSDLKKQRNPPSFFGKSKDPEVYKGVDFRFLFSDFLPDPPDKHRKRLHNDIREVGVRQPISIRIVPHFHWRDDLPSSQSTPPVMLSIEDEQLVKVRTDTEMEEPIPLPLVVVIDGELRLRSAICHQIPLEEIPFRRFTEPPPERAEQFRELLSNKQERKQFDELPDHSRSKLCFILDLWKTSTTRRNGLSHRGYTDMVTRIDKLFHGRFKQLSTRKMANLLGTNRNKISQIRRDVEKERFSASESSAVSKLKDLREKRNQVSSALNRLTEAFDDVQAMEGNDFFPESEKRSFEETAEKAIEVYDQQIDELSDKLNNVFDRVYEEAIAESHGPLEAFFEIKKTMPEAMDEVIDDELPDPLSIDPEHVSELDWDEYIAFDDDDDSSSADQ